MKTTSQSRSLRQKGVAFLLTLLLLPRPAVYASGREENVPLDPARERLNTEIAFLIGVGTLGIGSTTAMNVMVANQNYQDFLRTSAMIADDGLLTAYTHAQMQDLHAQLRQATSASRYFLQKLEADQAYFENQNFAIATPTWTPRTGAERELARQYRLIKAFLEKHRKTIEDAETPLMSIVTDVNKSLQGGGGFVAGTGRERLKLDADRIIERLVAYREAMTLVADEYQKTVVAQGASPMQQLRLSLFNNSKYQPVEWKAGDDPNAAAVFFVRIWERDAEGNYPAPRADTVSWLPIYPEGMTVTAKDQPEGSVVTLPSEVSIPVKLRDKLEVRIASFGMHRNRIRFLPVSFAGSLRPDDISLRRSYYFHGYQMSPPGGRTIISHWYPTSEKYTWTFRKAWGPGESAADPQYFIPGGEAEKTAKYQEIGADMKRYAGKLSLEGDHIVWFLPASLDSVGRNRVGEASVNGSAIFRKTGPTADREENYQETVNEGLFSFIMETW